MEISVIHKAEELPVWLSVDEIVIFLFKQLGKYTDEASAIHKAIEYAFSPEPGKGGLLLLAIAEKQLQGAVVMVKTGMDEFIPENILVYLAVAEYKRGQGLGSSLIEKAKELAGGAIAMHVEYDNPATELYKRLGFSSKYAELRSGTLPRATK